MCHPCWPQEKRLMDEAHQSISNRPTTVGINGWIILELFVFIVPTVYNVTSLLWIIGPGENIPNGFWTYYRIPNLIMCWLALNRPLMYLQALGPFIQMLAQTINTTGQFAFLFLEFLIPFVIGIYVTFGTPGGKIDRYVLSWSFITLKIRRSMCTIKIVRCDYDVIQLKNYYIIRDLFNLLENFTFIPFTSSNHIPSHPFTSEKWHHEVE